MTSNNTLSKKRVIYIYNNDFLVSCDKLVKIANRASMVHHLIHSYGLLSEVRLISPTAADEATVSLFHSKEYLDFLRLISDEEDEEKNLTQAEEFGLTYDCPAFPGVYEYAAFICGASLKAAHCLMMDLCDTAINWNGGWHHAKRDEAAGFCYMNDIVLAILKLRQKYSRVLYVDIDLHHGDGVEDAFCTTSKVMTVSFHKYSAGFFPGSGNPNDVGVLKGKYYSLNIPFKDGLQDSQLIKSFDKIMSKVGDVYKPEVVVCQCGADGLIGDPMDSFNLTHVSFAHCVKFLQNWNLPLLLLGGGGYHLSNTSRCWTYVTANILNKKLNNDIPDHEFFTEYGPDYELEIKPGNRPNNNTDEYIQMIIDNALDHLSNIS